MAWQRTGRFLKKFIAARGGAAAVEFVIIAPIAVILLFGTIEVSRFLYIYHAVDKGVRDATRYLTRVDSISCDDTGTGSGPSAAHLTNAQNLAETGTLAGGTGTAGWTTFTLEVEDPVECKDNTAGDFQGVFINQDYIPSLNVTATADVDTMFAGLLMQGNSITIEITHNEVHIGE